MLSIVLGVILATLIIPGFRMLTNISDIKNPQVGDIYIVNSTKLQDTEYYLWNKLKKKKLFETTFYRLLLIDKIENNTVHFKFSGFESNNLENVREWAVEEYKGKDFFSPNKWIVVPRNKLSSLNYRLMIVSIEKNNNSF